MIKLWLAACDASSDMAFASQCPSDRAIQPSLAMQDVAKLALARANELFEAVDRTAQKVAIARDKDQAEAGAHAHTCLLAPSPPPLSRNPTLPLRLPVRTAAADGVQNTAAVTHSLPAPTSKVDSIPFWSRRDDPSSQHTDSNVQADGRSDQSIVASRADAGETSIGAATADYSANTAAMAWGGNGGQHDAAVQTVSTRTTVAETLPSSQAAETLASAPDQHAAHQDQSRSAARMTAMLAQLRTQLKQQAAENVQLEELLKQADARWSSALTCSTASDIKAYSIPAQDEMRRFLGDVSVFVQDVPVTSSS